MTGDALLQVLATLANPHRMRVVAALAQERNYAFMRVLSATSQKGK